MRSIQECQAEVFRRSEKRIQLRRLRRKRLLAACVPAALCAGLLIWLTPAETNMPSEDQPPTQLQMNVSAGEAEAPMYGNPGAIPEQTAPKEQNTLAQLPYMTVTKGGQQWQITDASVIDQVYGLINTLELQGEENLYKAPEDSGEKPSDTQEGDQLSASAYVLAILLDDGGVQSFLVDENTLTNEETGDSYTLTTRQLTRLKQLLEMDDGERSAE